MSSQFTMRPAFDWFLLTIHTLYELQPDCNILSFVLVEREEKPWMLLCLMTLSLVSDIV